MSDVRAPCSTLDDLAGAVAYIERVQRESGLIPWEVDGPADPWDHVESAMALSAAGRREAAEAAYRWLADAQLDDGSWWAMYDATGAVSESQKETHRAAYAAVGVDHHYRVTGDESFVRDLWPTVEAAVEFALSHQAPTGEVYWAAHPDGSPHRDALVSSCSSIYKSLAAAVRLARVLDLDRERWLDARARVGEAVRSRPGRFDRTWEDKSRYSMHWFYPVLCGVVRGRTARDRLNARSDQFLVDGLGCRCVADEPWVTVAETAELVLALAAVGRRERAAEIFAWLDRWVDEDTGTYWTGYQFEDGEIWPEQRPTWTAGAAVLAADALGRLSPAHDYFTGPAPE
ncbi:MAG: prenyltransferase [Haloarculaceae archaeon]